MIKTLKLSGLPEIGKIKIGCKGATRESNTGSKKYNLPKKPDYFLITGCVRGEDGNFVVDQKLTKSFDNAGKPKELDICLPFNDINLNFATFFAYYDGMKRYCSGDGEKAERYEKIGDGYGSKKEYGPCGETCKDFKEKRCKPHGILTCIIKGQEKVGGAYKFRTTSWTSITNIISGLKNIQFQTGGWISWIPLKLKLVPETRQVEGKLRTIYVVQIYYSGNPEKLIGEIQQVLKLRTPVIMEVRKLEHLLKLLPSMPQEEKETEVTSITQEFYPDNVIEEDIDEDSPNNNGGNGSHNISGKAAATGNNGSNGTENKEPDRDDEISELKIGDVITVAKAKKFSLEIIREKFGLQDTRLTGMTPEQMQEALELILNLDNSKNTHNEKEVTISGNGRKPQTGFDSVINDKQRSNLLMTASKAGKSITELKKHVKDSYKGKEISSLTVTESKQILTWLEDKPTSEKELDSGNGNGNGNNGHQQVIENKVEEVIREEEYAAVF